MAIDQAHDSMIFARCQVLEVIATSILRVGITLARIFRLMCVVMTYSILPLFITQYALSDIKEDPELALGSRHC